MRENTAPGPGSRYAGILNATTAPHQSATMATNVRGGRMFHAVRRTALADRERLARGAPRKACAEGGACQSFGCAIPLAGFVPGATYDISTLLGDLPGPFQAPSCWFTRHR